MNHHLPLQDYAIHARMPEHVLRHCWRAVENCGLMGVVFRDDRVIGETEFMNWALSPTALLFGVSYRNVIKALAWFSNVEGKVGNVHFLTYPSARGHTVQMGLAFCQWALTVPAARFPDEPWLTSMIGSTPAENKLALRFIRRLGFEQLCTLERAYVDRANGQEKAAVISVLDVPRLSNAIDLYRR